MAGRAIDVPIEDLPAIDEHAIEVGVPAEAVWEVLVPVLVRAFGGPLASRVARALDCSQLETAGDLSHPGGTLPGFIVARSIPPVLLALLGSHRFSRYALVLRVDRLADDRSRVRAETRAEFPGVRGRAYRALVIGSRGHVLVVRGLLRGIKRRAERD